MNLAQKKFVGNHTVFLVQFGINLHKWVFQKAENSQVQINSKLSVKDRMIS